MWYATLLKYPPESGDRRMRSFSRKRMRERLKGTKPNRGRRGRRATRELCPGGRSLFEGRAIAIEEVDEL